MISVSVVAGFGLRQAAMEGILCSGAYPPVDALGDG
jgi:hypothetical protein